jgi:2-hydroxychromene-2-carboxylate isomerase
VSADLELFFDPVCPFCWLTSRWIEDVRSQRDLVVRYRPISLRMLNADEDPDGAMGRIHQRGLELLRVTQAAADRHGDDVVGPLYTALGESIHEQPIAGATEFGDVAVVQADRPADLVAVLAATGLSEDLVAATGDPSHDEAIRRSTEEALARAGDDVGTPVITFDPPHGPSFFGPTLSELPEGAAAVELFDATRTLAEHRPFTEFKRSLRALPDVAALAGIR